MSEIALQAVGLVRRIEGAVSHTLVNGIDLTVNKGEFLAITGPSGSGKSSLLYLLGLLDAPTEGDVISIRSPILFDGRRSENTPPPVLGEHTEEILAELGIAPTGK